MIAGLVSLLFNPSAWIAVALAAFVGFSGGFIKGYGVGDAGRLRLQANYDLATAKLQSAEAAKSERIVAESAADEEALRARAEKAEFRLAEAEKTINQILTVRAPSCNVPVEAIRAINSAR
jgi:hypothetical protein